MTEQKQIYKCNICGNIVEVMHAGVGQLVCCGQPMQLMEEKTQDQGQEKHVPVIEKTDKGIKVSVGSVPHPMEDSHYIEWIELICGFGTFKYFLNPSDKPEVGFTIGDFEDITYQSVYGTDFGSD